MIKVCVCESHRVNMQMGISMVLICLYVCAPHLVIRYIITSFPSLFVHLKMPTNLSAILLFIINTHYLLYHLLFIACN